jgi:catechol 2,3-dioxygenase-like lactoylglutathione lyase family enzyme
MGTSRVNHVSVNASDLEGSIAFYERLLGAERIATPNFGFPVQWLALGDTQLHLFDRPGDPRPHHHFGVEVDVDGLAAAYRICEELDNFDDRTVGHHLVELPGDVAQLYLRDPAGNLVELDAVGASRLPEDIRGRIIVLADERPQDGEHAEARLAIGADRAASV